MRDWSFDTAVRPTISRRPGLGCVVLKPASPNALHCYERALEARERALHAADAFIRDEFLASEARWLKLAESYELSERLADFVKKPAAFPTHPQCANCHVPMWLVEIQSDREKVEYHYECKACDSKSTITDRHD